MATAVVRPRHVPESVVALAGAGLLVAAGVLDWGDARDEAEAIGPTLALLAGLLVLGDACERAGLFDALAARIARGAGGSPRRLLALVFAAAAAVTAVLGLDATVVLLTPAAFTAARRARLDGRPSLYACTHLANTASVLLPVSNLTNLLAFRATDLSFAHFAALMVLPWAAMLAVEWFGITRTFAGELEAPPGRTPTQAPPLPRRPLIVLAATFVGFLVGIDPAWPAIAGALTLVALERVPPLDVLRAVDVPLLAFVLGLALIVRAVGEHGAADLAADLLPAGDDLLALLGATLVAAVLANLLNNVPAVLLLLPAAAAAGPATVLAVLIGVNAGPNLTPTGSLATLLWRRVLRAREAEPSLGEFLRLGALTVPPALVLGTVALWLALEVIG
ncbi:MAG TPA: SLC13 family permease [Solirubrobacteraceae bacterium]|nr:SLC13 family permease [Solirubrobacteraceae bacterium]